VIYNCCDNNAYVRSYKNNQRSRWATRVVVRIFSW